MRSTSRRSDPATTFSAAAREAMGKTWRCLVSTGRNDPWLEFYTGPMPDTPDDPLTAQQRMLVRMKVDARTLRPKQATAVHSGDATWARLIGADGKAVADFKATLRGGGGVFEIQHTRVPQRWPG